MPHICNFYCTPDACCDIVLAQEHYSATDVRRVLQTYLSGFYTIRNVMEAREADIATLEEEVLTYVTPDGHCMKEREGEHHPFEGESRRAWLFWWVKHETGQETSHHGGGSHEPSD